MGGIVGRRRALALGLTATPLALAVAAKPAAAQAPGLPESRGKTYVLVHGSWMGGGNGRRSPSGCAPWATASSPRR